MRVLSLKQDGKDYCVDAEDIETAEKVLSSMKKWVDNGFGHTTVDTVVKLLEDAKTLDT